MAVVHNLDRNNSENSKRYASYRIKLFLESFLYFLGVLYSAVIIFVIGWTILHFVNKLFFDIGFVEKVYYYVDELGSLVVDPIIAFGDYLSDRINEMDNTLLSLILTIGEYVLMIGIFGLLLTFGKVLRKISSHIVNMDGELAGIIGEKQALSVLCEFSDDYHVFTNLEFELRGHHETDLILVGPKGVYICEVKNWSGEVSFSDADKYVVRKRKKGKTEERVHSPIHQVIAHYETLRDALYAKGVYLKPSGMVFMMNRDVKLMGSIPSDVPVLKFPSKADIEAKLGRTTLTQSDIVAVVAALQEIALKK